eukprot:jgi/Botrbrau1/3656/Bobra.0204s0046.1
MMMEVRVARIVLCAFLAATLLALSGIWTLLPNPTALFLFGACPGPVLIPTPRTDWDWPAFADKLAEEVATADAAEEGFDLVWYGDSITENLRGTSVGHPWPGGQGAYDVYLKHFGQYSSDILAVAGDQVGHLWWRLLNGELPQVNMPTVAVVLIGTNDLTAADCDKIPQPLLPAAHGAAARVQRVLSLLRSMPGTHVVLQAVLPRGSSFEGDERYMWPNRFTKPIQIINDHFQALASGDPYVHYLDCGEVFLLEHGINPLLMPDGIHPFAAGLELQLACLEPFVSNLISNVSGRAPRRPGHPREGPSVPFEPLEYRPSTWAASYASFCSAGRAWFQMWRRVAFRRFRSRHES